MMVALVMALALSLSEASTTPPPPNGHFAQDTKREYVPMVGDSLAVACGRAGR